MAFLGDLGDFGGAFLGEPLVAFSSGAFSAASVSPSVFFVDLNLNLGP